MSAAGYDITRARHAGIEALLRARDTRDGVARVSDKTLKSTTPVRVNWAVADWLVLNGLAESPPPWGDSFIALTDRGMDAAVELGLLEPGEVAP